MFCDFQHTLQGNRFRHSDQDERYWKQTEYILSYKEVNTTRIHSSYKYYLINDLNIYLKEKNSTASLTRRFNSCLAIPTASLSNKSCVFCFNCLNHTEGSGVHTSSLCGEEATSQSSTLCLPLTTSFTTSTSLPQLYLTMGKQLYQ